MVSDCLPRDCSPVTTGHIGQHPDQVDKELPRDKATEGKLLHLLSISTLEIIRIFKVLSMLFGKGCLY